MRPLRTFLLFCALGSAACVAGADDPGTGEEEATASDKAVIALATASQKTLYVRLPDKPVKELTEALKDAAKRGVDARAVMVAGTSFDSAWMTQQNLESTGVDVDVRKDKPLDDVLAVGDDTALVPSTGATGSKKVTGAQAAAFAKRFTDLLDGAASHGELAPKNTVSIHPMPESTRDRIVAVFGAAKKSIDLEIYQLQDRGVIKALEAAAARHVKVRVMLEPKTVGGRNYDAVSKELTAAGITVQPTPPAFDSAHNVDHAKFAVIDDAELIFGTGNLVRSGLGGDLQGEYDNRDFWIEDTRSATLSAGRALFDADWARKATKASDFDAFVLTPDNANDKIDAIIDSAKHKLYLYNQSLDDDAIVAKLIAAKQRGADVHVLLGYQPGFGGPPANQAPIDKLRAAGIKADFLKKHYLHAKAIVADDKAYVGSQNFTNGGLRNNRELGEILDDGKIIDTLSTTFEADAR